MVKNISDCKQPTTSTLKGKIFSTCGACFIKKLREYHNISSLQLIKEANLSISLKELEEIEEKGLEMDINNFSKALKYLHSDFERFYMLSDIYLEFILDKKEKNQIN